MYGTYGPLEAWGQTLQKNNLDGETLVRVNADVKSGAKAVGLALEISSTRLDDVNDTESNGINNAFKLAEYSGDGLANDGNSVEEASLTNKNVQESLVDADKFTECIEDSIGLSTGWNFARTVHLSDGSSNSGNDIGEACDDLGKWTQADYDERTIDDTDTLSRGLKGLALLSDYLDVVDHLSRCDSCGDGSSEGQCGSEEVSDGNHFCGGERSFRFWSWI